MPENLVSVTANSHIAEGILGALIVVVSFLFKRSINHQDTKIEENRREIRAVSERNYKDIQSINERNRQTDQNIAEIHSNLSFIKGYLTNKDSENP